MTKREMFNTIKALEVVASNEEMVAFINHEIELLDKKSSKSAPTKIQKENETLIEAIFDNLSNLDKAVTISEFQSLVPEFSNLTNQKLSAMFKKLVDSGRVEKSTDKKKSFFKAVKVEV